MNKAACAFVCLELLSKCVIVDGVIKSCVGSSCFVLCAFCNERRNGFEKDIAHLMTSSENN